MDCVGQMGATDDLRAELAWPLLATRRGYQKLCLCRRILQGELLISADVFKPHPSPSGRRHVNSRPLFRQGVSTNYHRQSFFISVVSLWNAIPDSVVELSTQLAFKRHLKVCFVIFVLCHLLYIYLVSMSCCSLVSFSLYLLVFLFHHHPFPFLLCLRTGRPLVLASAIWARSS